jgi:hypothetical protein
MTFVPSLDSTRKDGFAAQVQEFLRDAAAMASLVPRVASRKHQPDYSVTAWKPNKDTNIN